METAILLLPEIVLLAMTCVILIAGLFCKPTSSFPYYMTQVTLLMVGVAVWQSYPWAKTVIFQGQFVVDPIAQVMKLFLLAILFFVFLYSRHYVQDKKIGGPEFYCLALFSVLGMLLLLSAYSLLMIYLGLELLSLPLYALVALKKDSPVSPEASIKYFIMGALASGLMLYGMSLLFLVAGGTLQLDAILQALSSVEGYAVPVAVIAMLFVLVGALFKLGGAPFHMWLPDVYEGAPTHITLFVASAPKIAALGMAYRLLHDTFGSFWGSHSVFLIGIALLSLLLGNTVALMQSNVKRLLAYSTIAQVGFLFLALFTAPVVGYAPALYYLFVYVLTVICAFAVLLLLSHQHFDAQTLEDLKGLSSRSPWIAFLMLLVVFSLAGVPPLVGFYAKLVVFKALVDAGWTWIAIVAVLFTVIGTFYYLKIVSTMYFESPTVPYAVQGKRNMCLALSFNGLLLLAFGIFPIPLYRLCQWAVGGG